MTTTPSHPAGRPSAARSARGWAYIQNQGDGTVLIVGSTRTGDGSPNPLRFGSGRSHQFVVGEITLTPSAVIATDALRGSGAGGLATSDHDLPRMLSQGECLVAPVGPYESGALNMAALMWGEPALMRDEPAPLGGLSVLTHAPMPDGGHLVLGDRGGETDRYVLARVRKLDDSEWDSGRYFTDLDEAMREYGEEIAERYRDQAAPGLDWRYATTGRTDDLCADSRHRVPGAARVFYLVTPTRLDPDSAWRLGLVGVDHAEQKVSDELIGFYPDPAWAKRAAQLHEDHR